jgi:hypothetical protein
VYQVLAICAYSKELVSTKYSPTSLIKGEELEQEDHPNLEICDLPMPDHPNLEVAPGKAKAETTKDPESSEQQKLADSLVPQFNSFVKIGVPCAYKSLPPTERAITVDLKATSTYDDVLNGENKCKDVDACHSGYMNVAAQTNVHAEEPEFTQHTPLRYGSYVVAFDNSSALSRARSNSDTDQQIQRAWIKEATDLTLSAFALQIFGSMSASHKCLLSRLYQSLEMPH